MVIHRLPSQYCTYSIRSAWEWQQSFQDCRRGPLRLYTQRGIVQANTDPIYRPASPTYINAIP